jgi:hypothetical protein
MYDAESLIALLEGEGFVATRRRECQDSQIENIEALEERTRVQNGAGVCVEGLKPAAPK